MNSLEIHTSFCLSGDGILVVVQISPNQLPPGSEAVIPQPLKLQWGLHLHPDSEDDDDDDLAAFALDDDGRGGGGIAWEDDA